MAKKRKSNPRRSIRQLKKTLKRMGRTRAQRSETVGHVKRLSRSNPPKMKRKAPKGWLKATAVKIRRRNGRVEVLVRK